MLTTGPIDKVADYIAAFKKQMDTALTAKLLLLLLPMMTMI